MKEKSTLREQEKIENTVQKTISEDFLLKGHWTKIQNYKLNKNENRRQEIFKEYSGVDPTVEVKETCLFQFFFLSFNGLKYMLGDLMRKK